jgi:glycosyltransferase involved in cell wall biosynthesis
MDFSIIIPVYNVEQYLIRCIESVIIQTFTNWEIILVNDCSPDNSQKIIDSYTKKDFRIKSIVNESNKGLGGARNIGLKAAKGDYLMFLDSDDYISDETVLQKLHKQARTFNLDVIDSRYRVLKDENEPIFLPKRFLSLNENVLTGKIYLNTVSILPVVAWNKVYKRSFIEMERIVFKERKYEDICFTLETIYKSKRVQNTDVVFYNYIIRPGSIMTSKPDVSSINDAWALCKDLELMFHEYERNYEIEKNFYYSFVSLARLLTSYESGNHKKSIQGKLSKIHNKYRLSILKAKKLGVKQKLLLFSSPYLMSYVLSKLKN